MATALHPAFEAAAPENRWHGKPLSDLWEWLNEAVSRESVPAAWVVLPHGAHVKLEQLENGKRQLTIARKEPFKTTDGETLWLGELATFYREFGVLDWERTPGESKQGGPKITLTERVRQNDFFGGDC